MSIIMSKRIQIDPVKFPPRKQELLIPILQEIQHEQGYLDNETLEEAGRHVGLPANKVHGVATFYNQFTFRPRGTFHIQVCNGTSCHVFGNTTFLQELEKQLGIKAGTTSRDGKFTLELVTCLGACSHSPVILINGKPYQRLTQETLTRIINSIKEQV